MIIMLCYLCLGVIKEPLAIASSVLMLCLFCYSFSTHFFNFIFVRLPLLHVYNQQRQDTWQNYKWIYLFITLKSTAATFTGITDSSKNNISSTANTKTTSSTSTGMISLSTTKWYVNNTYSKISKIWNNIHNIYCLTRLWGQHTGIFYRIDT